MARGRPTNPPARLNRTLLALAGLLLLGAAATTAGIGLGRIPLAAPGDTVLPPAGDVPTWAVWVTALVGTLVGLAALRWLLAQARRRPAGTDWTAPSTGDVAGTTTATSDVIAGALRDDLVGHPAVVDARARLTAPAPDPVLYLEMSVDAHEDPAAAREHLDTYALPRLRAALGVDALPTVLLLRSGRAPDTRRLA